MVLRATLVLLAICCTAVFAAGPKSSPPVEEVLNPTRMRMYPRPAENWLEAQIVLARHAISCGPIDGLGGAQSAAALRAFQQREELPDTGQLDNATRAKLILTLPPFAEVNVTAEDLASLQPLGKTWLEKSNQTALAHETALELVAERTRAHPSLLQKLNPTLDWAAVTPSTRILAPDVRRIAPLGTAAHIHISLSERTLQVRNDTGALVTHCPVSIARMAEKRPEGELRVAVVIPNPDYTFDPEVYPESPEAQAIGHKLVVPPGPNNPVGLAWIGLDRPGYGIHGTPTPEHVGRTGSHGCFRLANWDALTLLELAFVGLPVIVDP